MRLGPRFHPPFRAAGRVRFLHKPRHLPPSHGSADRAKAGGRPPVSLKAHCDTATPRRVHAVPGGSSLTAGSVGELRQRPSCPRTRGLCPPARYGQVRRPRIHVETWGRTWTRKRRRHLGGPRAGTDVSCCLGTLAATSHGEGTRKPLRGFPALPPASCKLHPWTGRVLVQPS